MDFEGLSNRDTMQWESVYVCVHVLHLMLPQLACAIS